MFVGDLIALKIEKLVALKAGLCAALWQLYNDVECLGFVRCRL